MAFGIMSAPGEKFGPCVGPCKHVDCAATRKDAGKVCRICRDIIGYGRPFNDDAEKGGEKALAHHVCLVEEAERSEKAKANPVP